MVRRLALMFGIPSRRRASRRRSAQIGRNSIKALEHSEDHRLPDAHRCSAASGTARLTTQRVGELLGARKLLAKLIAALGGRRGEFRDGIGSGSVIDLGARCSVERWAVSRW